MGDATNVGDNYFNKMKTQATRGGHIVKGMRCQCQVSSQINFLHVEKVRSSWGSKWSGSVKLKRLVECTLITPTSAAKKINATPTTTPL